MAKLTLDANVNLHKLQQFATDAGDKSIRMKVENGVKVLYTSDKNSSGVKNLFTGQSDQRRHAATAEIRQLASSFMTAAENLRIPLDANVKASFPQAGKLTGADLANKLQAVRDDARTGAGNRSARALGAHALESRDPDALNAARDLFADRILRRLDAAVAASADPAAKRIEIVASHGDSEKNRLVKFMAGLGGAAVPPGTTYATASPEARKLVDQAYDQAAANLAGNKLLDPRGDELRFEGHKYVRERAGGVGGFGTVDIYKRDGGDERIAVKRPLVDRNTPPRDQEKKFDAYAAELTAHARVAGGGDPNVVGLKGALRGAFGEPMIVLESAPHGNVQDAQAALAASAAPTPAKAAAGLTMLLDMAKGLAHAHEQGVVHLDVKGPNFLLGDGGVAKLADMGTSGGVAAQRADAQGNAVGGANLAVTERTIMNPTWLAPEYLHGSAAMTAAVDAAGQGRRENAAAAKQQMEQQGFPKDQVDAATRHINALYQGRKDAAAAANPIRVSEKADVWSFGICAYQMLFPGDLLPETFRHNFASESENMIMAFAGNPNHRVFTAPPGGQLTADQQFVNELLHPDPAQRPAMQDVVNHPIFQRLGVGSPEAYGLITALGTPNEAAAVAALTTASLPPMPTDQPPPLPNAAAPPLPNATAQRLNTLNALLQDLQG